MLAAWGGFIFEAPAPAFDKLTRNTTARWKDHDIIGRRPAGQYLGPGKMTVTLTGVTFPADDGGAGSGAIAGMEAACAAGDVNDLVTGSGSVAGAFRLESISVDESFHDVDGAPGRVGYTLNFAAQDDGAGAIWSLWP